MRIPGLTALWIIGLTLCGTLPAAAQGIGVASAVKNDVTGTLGGSTTPLGAGNPLFQRQVIATGSESAAQLLFLDETSLNLGPNSEVTLDTFVYDPARRTGDIVLETGKGVFRFVTGSSTPTSYKLKTASATIGFRGSIADIIGDPLTIICVEPTFEVIMPDGTVFVLDTPGEAITINDDGSVEGPYTYTGEYYEVVEGFAFPLYADGFLGDPRQVELPDGKLQIIDETESDNPGPNGGEIIN